MNVKTSCRDILELNSKARTACNLFLRECKKQGINIFITETYRSQERQNYLYEQGRARAGNKVTWTKNSRHTSRRAWDIACSPPNRLYDINIINKAGAIATKLGITWGGTWSTPDKPHFEINSNWKEPKEDTMGDKKPIDNTPDSWAKPSVDKAILSGFIKGDGNGNYNLHKPVTRQEMMVFLDRAGLIK